MEAARRSRRDAQPSARAAAAQEAAAAASAASGGPGGASRRSQRHVKPPEEQVTDEDAGKQLARRRSRPSSPAPAPASPPPRTSSGAPSAENSPALAATAGRRRRPTARAAAGDGLAAATGSYAPHKALGRHSARECTLLCEVILDDVRRSALAADVLEKDRPPAAIRWEKVAKRMLKTHKIALTPRECQDLWKFLAYAQTPEDVTTEELLPSSDEEDIERPIREINARQGKAQPAQKKRARLLAFPTGAAPYGSPNDASVAPVGSVEASSGQAASSPKEATPVATGAETHISEATQQGKEKSDELSSSGNDDSRGTPVELAATPKSPTQLYPNFELPPGAVSGWTRPFNFKQMLPLTFVAEKFLKKRAVTPQPASQLVTPPLITALATKSPVVAGNAVDVATPSTTLAASTVAQNPIKSEITADSKGVKKRKTNDASADKPRKKPLKGVSIPSQPRQPFVPSSTPPPVPIPARTELEFYRFVHARLAGAASAEAMSVEDLARAFNAAAPSMQAECKKLALIDLDRFNRECVRRRIWEKAMGAGSNSNSPLPSPAPEQQPTPIVDATALPTMGDAGTLADNNKQA